MQFVGLDVHKRVVEACILNESGAVVRRERFACTGEALREFCREELEPEDKVAVEATTNTWGVVDILKPYVDEVVVSNPLRTKAIAHAKVKTDKVDAYVLAQLLRCDYLPRVWEPDERTRQIRYADAQASVSGLRPHRHQESNPCRAPPEAHPSSPRRTCSASRDSSSCGRWSSTSSDGSRSTPSSG